MKIKGDDLVFFKEIVNSNFSEFSKLEHRDQEIFLTALSGSICKICVSVDMSFEEMIENMEKDYRSAEKDLE